MSTEYHTVDGANPTPSAVRSEVFQRGLRYMKPALPFEPAAWETRAKEHLGASAWGYVHGKAGLGQSYDNNIEAKNNGYDVLAPIPEAGSIGVATGFTDPLFRKSFKEKYGKEIKDDEGRAAADWIDVFMPGCSHSREDVAFLKQHWDGPIVLKGIQGVEDAKLAVEYGVEGHSIQRVFHL